MLTHHTARSYDIAIDHLRSNVLKMGGLVERQVQRALDALIGRSMGLVADVLAEESVVNGLQKQVDLQANQLIAKRQPLGADLREVLAALHMTNDLERIGDEAKKIALRVGRILQDEASLPLEPVLLRVMSDEACDMLRQALDAVVRQDDTVAAVLRQRDRALDQQRRDLTASLLAQMERAPDQVATAVELVMIVQSLERVGDHAKNVAQYMVAVVQGVQRHHDAPRNG